MTNVDSIPQSWRLRLRILSTHRLGPDISMRDASTISGSPTAQTAPCCCNTGKWTPSHHSFLQLQWFLAGPRARSAAPTYFKPVRLEDPETGISEYSADAGLAQNNPVELVLTEGGRIWTGVTQFHFSAWALGSLGRLDLLKLATPGCRRKNWKVGPWSLYLQPCKEPWQ